MLKLNRLPLLTRRVYDLLSSQSALAGFTLIGGTALALQLDHRHSEDLDLWLPDTHLNKLAISTVIHAARDAGLEPRLTTPHHQRVAAKINGLDLLAHSQNYVIGGVKVTFFARIDMAYRYFNGLPRADDPGAHFQVMREDGIFFMKSHVIHHRVKSRDLFDLKALLQRGKTIDDILSAGLASDPSNDPGYAKSVLTGEIPLDADDEGLSPVGVSDSIDDLYSFFRDAVKRHEIDLAGKIYQESLIASAPASCEPPPCP